MSKLKAFKRAPCIHNIMYLKDPENGLLLRQISDARGNAHWVPARTEGYPSVWHRFKCAWLVFTGRADALTWPEDSE